MKNFKISVAVGYRKLFLQLLATEIVYESSLWWFLLLLGFWVFILFYFIFVNKSWSLNNKISKETSHKTCFRRRVFDNLEIVHFMRICFMLDLWTLLRWSFCMTIIFDTKLSIFALLKQLLSFNISRFHNIFILWFIKVCEWNFITWNSRCPMVLC